LTWRFSRGRVGGFFGAVPFYRNRFPPSSPNALCASALALRAPYDAQSVVNAQRNLPYTSRNKIRPLSGSIPERRRLVSDLDRRSHKVPFDFYYRYLCDSPEGEKEHRHKIVDWEAGALYWNCRRNHGDDWEAPFRAKLEGQLGGKDLMFLMGNQHRFQDQWLIISLIYPPKRKPIENRQGSLF